MLDDEREESACVEADSSRGAMMATCHCRHASKANGERTMRCQPSSRESVKVQEAGLVKEEY